MSEIRVIEKPANVSYETIRDIIHKAHQVHFDKGIVMKITTLSAKELEERVTKNNGKCYIAMENERIIGTLSYIKKYINHWYKHGNVIELTMIGILPDYQGKHIFSKLYEKLEEMLAKDYDMICCDTAINNIHAQLLYEKLGFVYVDFFASPSKHYSVEMVKWLKGNPYSKRYCDFRYKLKQLYTVMRFKPGKTKRFGI